MFVYQGGSSKPDAFLTLRLELERWLLAENTSNAYKYLRQ